MHECKSEENATDLCEDFRKLTIKYCPKMCVKCFSEANITMIILELRRNEFTKKEIKELIEFCFKEVYELTK